MYVHLTHGATLNLNNNSIIYSLIKFDQNEYTVLKSISIIFDIKYQYNLLQSKLSSKLLF